jgi:hypothetical protein|tara:strand:+ start:1302 stop:2705 length:1404 start_codon:yes stop_codon:yes gene_type:complete
MSFYLPRGLQQLLLLVIGLTLFFSSFLITTSAASALGSDQKFCAYGKKNYQGDKLCGNQEAINWLGWTWAQQISSLQVASDYELIGYSYPFLLGEPVILAGDVEQLSRKWNNSIVSFKLRSKMANQQGVCFYSKKNYKGRRFCTDESSSLISLSWYKKISSISIPTDKQVILYKYWFYSGATTTLEVSTAKLKGNKLRFFSYQIEDINANADADSDGVNDDIDQCPETLLGETVDANGCALSQLDTDADGINDALDICPNTAAGQSVNDNGCALTQLDSDSDSVSDAIDQCPNTPQGETANTKGCSLSQIDTDNDGINDSLDQCPETVVGESVNANGCSLTQLDSDGDGASDAIDQCTSTPFGESITAQGCGLSQLDTDDDDIKDLFDQCPSSPTGQSVNNQGCALNQLDSDNDGVTDDIDRCRNTEGGNVVDSTGCIEPIVTRTTRTFIYSDNGQMTDDDVQGSVE